MGSTEEESFQHLKNILTNGPVLNIANPNKDILVCIDAYKEELSRVLMQEGHVISYESKQMNDYEKKYVTFDLEFVSIVHTLKMWRYYLLERIFVLMIDHNRLKYLFDQPQLNAR